jgi:tetratricopeptide (TPR) repeat protein
LKKNTFKKVFFLILGCLIISCASAHASSHSGENPDNLSIGVEKHLTLAKKHLEKNNWPEAFDMYTKAIVLKPHNASLYYARGITSFAQAYSIKISFGVDPETRKHASHNRMALFGQSINDLNKAIELEPHNVSFYFMRALAHSMKFDKRKSITDLSKIISIRSDITWLYFIRGKEYFDLGLYKYAINDFTQAITLKADTPEELHLFFTTVIFPQKHEDLAPIQKHIGIENLLKEYNPKWILAKIYYYRGRCYQETNQTSKTVHDFNQSISIDPEGFKYFHVKEKYVMKKKFHEAIQLYSKLIYLHPENDDLYFDRAFFYKISNIYDKAINDYNMAIKLCPKGKEYLARAYAYIERGDLYKKKRQYLKARDDFQSACDLNESLCTYVKLFDKEIKLKENK